MTILAWFLAGYFATISATLAAVTHRAHRKHLAALQREAEVLDRLDALHVSLHGRCPSRAECAATCSQLEGLRWQLLELEHPQPAEAETPPARRPTISGESVLMVANLVARPQPEEAA
jgi:hypothetical protein